MFGASAERRDPGEGNKGVASFGGRFEVGEFFGMRLQVLKEPFKLVLHRVHLLAHVENDLDSREIHTQVARQRENELEPLEIRIRVEACVALRA